MALLEKINSPKDIKQLTIPELEQLCSEIRDYIISCCANNPGHIASSLGAVEIAVALHNVFNTPTDKLIWDVGHQAYAHKIITGRREAFKLNRTKNGISGFPKMSESEYDAFGAGHASTSISAALGMAVATSMQSKNEQVVAIIGDGAMTGGLAFEGLNNAGSLKSNLLVILNDNQQSIDENTGALHNYLVKVAVSEQYNRIKDSIWDRLGAGAARKFIQKRVKNLKRVINKGDETGSLFDSLGFRYFGPIDGNDIEQMVTTLKKIKNISGPKLLHVITVKGKGYKPAEEDQTIWHAPGKFDPATGERIPSGKSASRYQDVFGQTLLDLAKANDKIVGITPAMATGCGMNIMSKEMPDRVFDVGIAEGHAVTFSAGLAAEGMIPFCNIYSSFSQRAYDNIIHDVALQKLKVVLCLDRGGIVGEDGPTHHGMFDMAALRPIPNLTIASPMNECELRNLMYSATCMEYGPTVIRYPRGCGEGLKWIDTPYIYIPAGTAVKLHDGNKLAVLSIGPVGNKVRKVVDDFERDGINILHYDMRFVKPIDKIALEEICNKVDTIITIEDGSIMGALHSAVSEYVADNCKQCKVVPMGAPDRYISQGTPEELYSECGYNTDDIIATIKSLL